MITARQTQSNVGFDASQRPLLALVASEAANLARPCNQDRLTQVPSQMETKLSSLVDNQHGNFSLGTLLLLDVDLIGMGGGTNKKKTEYCSKLFKHLFKSSSICEKETGNLTNLDPLAPMAPQFPHFHQA